MKKGKVIYSLLFVCILLFQGCSKGDRNIALLDGSPACEKYDAMQRSISKGWNTWDTRSVFRHVLLPYGLALDINLESPSGERGDRFFIGDGSRGAHMIPGPHSYDGYYTDITAEWKGMRIRVESAAEDLSEVLIISPQENNLKGGKIIISLETLWQRASSASIKGNTFKLTSLADQLDVEGAVYGEKVENTKNEFILSADHPVIITCGTKMDQTEAQQFIDSHYRNFVEKNKKQYGGCYEEFNAMQTVLGWNTIYDPTLNKVITPVSRLWNVGWSNNPSYGGFILFCWDTYFASMMLSVGSKELAYANAVEITRGITENGFVPNFYSGGDYKSRDRSQPPIGSLTAWTLYKKYKEKWLLEVMYERLLRWNRWWNENRKDEGLLCWGSTPYHHVTYRYWEFERVNTTKGGSLESGLDNTHMYDNVPYNQKTHLQQLNDVGLNSLYIMDCKLLAKIADILGQESDKKELLARGREYSQNMSRLWDEKTSFYYNLRTDTKEFNTRTSPTNFYPMLADIPDNRQAEEMIRKHMLNPEEYWGDWILPATPRNDPAFKDNTYWRGRIWAPLNFLVYMGLRNYDTPTINKVRKEFAEKSKALLLKSWNSQRYVFENYNATNGLGNDVPNSDRFYHWGALLGYINLIEQGFYFNEESPL